MRQNGTGRIEFLDHLHGHLSKMNLLGSDLLSGHYWRRSPNDYCYGVISISQEKVITNQPWELEIKKIPSRNKVDGNTVGSELTEKILFRLPMISWMRALLMDIS